jgi:hypothetical protein
MRSFVIVGCDFHNQKMVPSPSVAKPHLSRRTVGILAAHSKHSVITFVLQMCWCFWCVGVRVCGVV